MNRDLKVGDTVQILSFKAKTHLLFGTLVYRHNDSACEVKILKNQNSVYENCIFRYNASNLHLVDKTESNEVISSKQTEQQINSLDYKVVKVKFVNGYKNYNSNNLYYYAMFDNYEVGDSVVVKSAHHGLGIAVINSIVEKPTKATIDYCEEGREIVDRIDSSRYSIRKERRNKIKDLKTKIDEKVSELQKSAIIEILAKNDSELNSLLTEYKHMTKKSTVDF